MAASLADTLAQSEDWQSVLVHFDFHEGFAFGLLLVAGSPLGEACKADLERHLAVSGKQLLDLSPTSPQELVERCLSLSELRVGPEVGCIWISAVVSEYQTDFREWEESFRNAFARLNPVRNVLQRNLPCTLLFVGAPWVQAAIRSMAPDLWSVRTLVTGVSSVPMPASTRESSLPTPSTESPDPNFALREAASLRGKPGSETALIRLLERAGEGFMAQVRFEEAAQAFQEAVSVRKSISSSRVEIARAELMLARALVEPGHYAAGLIHVRAAQSLLGEPNGESTFEELDSLHEAAGLLTKAALVEDAENLMQFIVPLAAKLLGPEDPTALDWRADLAFLMAELGNLSVARSMQEEVLELSRKVYGLEDPRTLTVMNNLASTLWAQGELDGAQALEEQALEARRRLLGADHVDTLTSLNNLAATLADRGDYVGAISLGEEVVAGLSRTLGPEHPSTLTTRGNIGLFRQRMGDLEAAKQELEPVYKSRRNLFGPGHVSTIQMAERLAEVYEALGLTEEAGSLMREIQEGRDSPSDGKESG